jgi:hypothetical protein
MRDGFRLRARNQRQARDKLAAGDSVGCVCPSGDRPYAQRTARLVSLLHGIVSLEDEL